MLIFLVTLLVILDTAGMFFGILFTEKPKYRLADKYKWLDFKPFNCKPCLTFHFIWIFQVIAAILLGNLQYGILGIISAFIIMLGLYIEDKNKIEK